MGNVKGSKHLLLVLKTNIKNETIETIQDVHLIQTC